MPSFPQRHLARFESEILATLNPIQRQAVDHIDGPVMVIAGPGTGKTQLLAARIGNILRLTDTDPREILCLTYTEAGTTAMRERLISFIGPEGYRVPVHTFHGFCNLVIQENPGHFGGYRDLQPITDLERRTLLKELIDELDPTHPIRKLRGDFYSHIPRLASLFATMKKENLTPDEISAAIDRYLTDLPTRDGFYYKRKYKQFEAGDPKQADIARETKRLEETRAAAALLPDFQNRMDRAGRYDFTDMLRWVHQAFLEDESLLRTYQERFLYILVDEYQDTSGLQNELLYQLASFWTEPNLFVVGDDDQAIYRFQGASMQNILDFHARFSPTPYILADNYRSGQAILNAADALINRNLGRLNQALGLKKQLTARNTSLPQPGVSPQLLEFATSTGEETWIVGRIRELLDRGVPAGQIAVLYRNHRHAENLLRLCRQAGVPVHQQRRENILHDPFIRSLLQVLTYIQGEYSEPFSEELRLVEILHYRYFGLQSLDVARLLRYMRQDYYQSREQGRTPLRWRELLQQEDRMQHAGVTDPERIRAVADDLEYWIGHLPEMTIQQLFEKILTRGGVLATILNDPQKRRLLELVTTLFDTIKAETARQPAITLGELLDQFAEMEDGKIDLPYVHYIGNADGVPFSTIHSAKGLEWAHVFMLGSSAKNWSGRSTGRDYKLPDTLHDATDTSGEDGQEEERRLFFVGMTRAKEGLCISYARDQKNANSKKSASADLAAPFFWELHEHGALPIAHHEQPAAAREAGLEALLHPLDENPALLEESWLKEQVADLVMSVTALNKYLTCPRSFYYENILRVPGARNRYMGYGSAVHRALETVFRQNPALTGPVAEQVVQAFDTGLQHYRSHFTDQEFVNTREHGHQVLPHYVQESLNQWREPDQVEVEKNIQQVEWQGFPIGGKLDKVEIYPDGITVVDYKTGKPENARKKLKPAGEDWRADPGGDYWRQLVFYRMLVDADRTMTRPFKAGVMEFVEPDSRDQFSRVPMEITDEHLKVVSEQLEFAFNGIRDLAFSQGCHDPQCLWCNLIDHHILPESLTDHLEPG